MRAEAVVAARATEGAPEPLGVSLTSAGVNVAVHAPGATAVEVCLFDADGQSELARIVLPGRTGPVAHGHIDGVAAGARYGLRTHGPFAPAEGLRFNPNKLLVDPYALALDRPFRLDRSMFGYRPDDPRDASSFDDADSAAAVPKAIVTATPETISAPEPNVPWAETVIYELHVRGFTRTHPGIAEELRGTFAALAHPAAIDHLRRLGVTTIELLPCAAWIDERHLPPLGLGNYWGYNPVCWMAPDPRLAPGGWPEIRAATSALAAAGIETVLDVVFNHTGEGDELGPTLSLRGLDNAGYYRLRPGDPAHYVNDAGTGNVLALDRPAGLRLAMDALRAWRRLGGVAGFRFDLATVLGRRPEGFDPEAPLLAAIAQDPELRELKLIAEPWDCGPGGYQLGRFPAAWGEWNDRFRDTVRGFWRGDAVSRGELAGRLSGSEALFAGRRPSRSIIFVVAHDGFTLADLVSFEAKHNLANGEGNADGAGDSRSWNHGIEGPTDDAVVCAARLADQRALLATVMLARGTPMLAMGAELGHSQGGNNNAYAQDNAVGWLDWAHVDAGLTGFTARLAAIRREHPAFRADRFLTGEQGDGIFPDVVWRGAACAVLTPADWDDPAGETLVMVLAEQGGADLDRVILALHRGGGPAEAVLPEPRDGHVWTLLIDSADPERQGDVDLPNLELAARSVVAIAETPAPTRRPRGVDAESLARLAAAAGIAPEWWSVDGERHAVSVETQQALLAAMRLPAQTSQQAAESLRALAEAHDLRPLPYAMVWRAGAPITMSLPFEAGAPPPRTWLTIEDEAGGRLRLPGSPQVCDQTAIQARDGRRRPALDLALPPLEAGRYRLLREDRPDTPCTLTVAPPSCYAPPAFEEGRRLLGLSAQLYSVWRRGDQGIGDFTSLGELGRTAATHGAALLGINPLHALFNDRRDRASPYYPSDRRFHDPIYLDLDDAAPQSGPPPLSIDYPAVWASKARALEARFTAFDGDPDFTRFVADGDEALLKFARFQAIAETRPGEPWRAWPAGLQGPDRPDASALAGGRIGFHLYVQWLCARQLAAAAERAGGLELGFCRDLAVGAAPDGAEAWACANLMAEGVSIGAPPDPIAPMGQIWGLPPFDPHRLRADGYSTVAELFRLNMRHAGALRIDHVMGLARQFWVPEGARGSDGAYVAYPWQDLIGELALESARGKCLVIGEDLGTAPHGLRDSMADAGILSYRVLGFEREGLSFKAPAAYPPLSWACVATHDLPTLAGWWEGLDIAEGLQLRLIDPAAADRALAERGAEKHVLLEALDRAGKDAGGASPTGPLTPALAGAIHAYIASTPSVLAVAQVEDLAGERTAVNLPGTDQERPNWRRRIATPLEDLFDTPAAQAILFAMRDARFKAET